VRKLLGVFVVVAGMAGLAGGCEAAPVEYVKVCSLFGADFYYIPGTDVCFNVTTGETRQATAGGVWTSTVPGTPGAWVANPKLDCLLGRLVKVGTFTSASFALNAHEKYETAPVSLTIATDDYVSKVMLSGGFNATSKSTFCLSFFDVASGAYSTLGCENTASFRDQPATYSFSPLRSVPPSSFLSPYRLVGNNGIDQWGAPPVSFDGVLSCWVCIQKVIH
jgi:hypothetical protein